MAKIKNAYLQNLDPSLTDDTMFLEKTGEKIHPVEGNIENIKITNPEDLFRLKRPIHMRIER